MSTTTPATEELAAHIELVDRAKWLEPIEDRFGIPLSAFDDYHLIRPNNRSLSLVARGHRPPLRPKPDIIGMSFLRTRMRFPKLTTAAAMHFGPHATRNHLALSQEQADAFLSREPFEIDADQAATCTGTGYVLPHVEEVFLGVAFFRADEDGGGSIESMFPKAWTLAEDESAFED